MLRTYREKPDTIEAIQVDMSLVILDTPEGREHRREIKKILNVTSLSLDLHEETLLQPTIRSPDGSGGLLRIYDGDMLWRGPNGPLAATQEDFDRLYEPAPTP